MGKLNEQVRAWAVEKVGGKYNLPQYKAEKERMLQRNAVCKELVELADTNHVPMSFLTYFAVSKESHKVPNFEKSVGKFNRDKAVAIIVMSKEFGEHNGYKTPTDKVYHAMCAYYERCSADHDVFKSALDAMTPCNTFGSVKAICEALGMVCGE